MSNGSNHAFASRDDVRKIFRTLGRQEGEGALARPEFIVTLALAAQDGHYSDTKKDAEEAWTDFRSQSIKKAGNVTDGQEKSAGTRISECKTIIKTAMIPALDLPTTLRRAIPIVKSAEGAKGPTWDRLVKVVRVQADTPTRNLSDDEIRNVFTVSDEKEARAKDEKAQLETIKKALSTLINGSKKVEDKPGSGKEAYPSEEASAALDLIEQRLLVLELADKQAKFAAMQVANSTLIKRV
jgi:hypothetical protein